MKYVIPLLAVAIVAVGVCLGFYYCLRHECWATMSAFYDGLTVAQVRDFSDGIRHLIAQKPLISLLLAVLFYTLICSVPFPFVSLVTLLVGYLFGLVQGVLITSIGSAVGGSILFMISRRFLVGRHGQGLINTLTGRFPSLAVFADSQDFWIATSVRFVPGLPFFIPSLLFSATKLSLFRFFLATQLGLFVTMLVYVNAGRSLAEINSLNQLFSPTLVISMLMIAMLPFVYRLLIKMNVLPTQ